MLAGCPHLRQLTLSAAPAPRGAGGQALGSENPVSALPGLRAALATVLPRLDALDGVPLAPKRAMLPHASAPGAAAQARNPCSGMRIDHPCRAPLARERNALPHAPAPDAAKHT